MAIDIDTARRIAKLARIRVEEDLPALAQDFAAILGFIEQLNEVDVSGVEPMVSVTPMRLKRRPDGGDRRQPPGRCAGECPRCARRLLRGAEGGRMSLNELTIAAARDGLRNGEFTAAELTEACLTAIEGAGALNAFVHNTPEIARAQAARPTNGWPPARRRRCAASRWGSRISTAPRACPARPARASSPASARPTNPPSPGSCSPPAR